MLIRTIGAFLPKRFSAVSFCFCRSGRKSSLPASSLTGHAHSALSALNLQSRLATSRFSWLRHSSAAMAAAAADASRRFTALTQEEEGRRTAAKVFESSAQLPRAERASEQERGRGIERVGEAVGRPSENECLVCGVLFTSQEKLRLHTASHTGEKPFQCSQPHCPKAFSSKYKLFR